MIKVPNPQKRVTTQDDETLQTPGHSPLNSPLNSPPHSRFTEALNEGGDESLTRHVTEPFTEPFAEPFEPITQPLSAPPSPEPEGGVLPVPKEANEPCDATVTRPMASTVPKMAAQIAAQRAARALTTSGVVKGRGKGQAQGTPNVSWEKEPQKGPDKGPDNGPDKRSQNPSEYPFDARIWATVVDTLAAVLAAGLVSSVGLPWGEALPLVPPCVANVLRTPKVGEALQSAEKQREQWKHEEQGAKGKQGAYPAKRTPMARIPALATTGLGVSGVKANGFAVATTPVANPSAMAETQAHVTGRADEVNEANDAKDAKKAPAFEAFSPFVSSLPSTQLTPTQPTTQPTVRVIGRLVLTQGIPLTTHDPDWVSTLEAEAKDAVRSGKWAKALANTEATFRRQWDAPPGVSMGMLTMSRRETYPTPYAQWRQHQGSTEASAKRSIEANADPLQMALSTFSRTYLFIDTDNPVQAAFFERFITGAEPLRQALTERVGRRRSTKDAGVTSVLDTNDLRIVFVKGNLAQWQDRLATLTGTSGEIPLPLYFDQGGSLAARLHVTALPTFVRLTAEVMDLWTPALTADGNPLDPLPDDWGVWPTEASTESTAFKAMKAKKATKALPTRETQHE